jgi:nucleoside-diphosphate-sugar epimerase
MKYLVLGSSGQLGSALCQYLTKQGHTVAKFDIEDGDLYDLRLPGNPALDQCMQDCDFVFFLAWDVGGSVYLARYQNTFDFMQNNIKITANVFESIRKHNKPFVFASSQMANMSYSSYGLTKSLAEKITATLDGITVKFWNVYGLEHDMQKSHVITDFIIKARDTGVIDMRTDGTEQRQMLHADDCSECLYLLSTRYDDLPRDQEYHITSFEWSTVLDIAGIIAERFPGTVIKPAVAKDTVQLDKRNEADPWILNFWKPKIGLHQGINNIINEMEKSV